MSEGRPWNELNTAIMACEKCPRLRAYCANIAQEKRRAFRDQTYWGRPVPGWGDPNARILIVGLAPAAHGANRTGRMFTGDRSGSFLYSALYRTGLANQPTSVSRDDGLKLTDVYITAATRCAPPDNKPTPGELHNCRPYLVEELRLLQRARVIVPLGRIAFDNSLRALEAVGASVLSPRPRFAHGATCRVETCHVHTLIASYHPSRRNTQTGLLTPVMFDRIFQHARALAR
ncbi:MAG TPA: uracil-DNA glycosylase [Anaerolineae bacterium]|nr:uracil-DNA glycosylase [Anaerolineae bacterium]